MQEWIAESRAEISAARLLVLHTAEKLDAEGPSAVRDDISLIKFYVAGVMHRVLDRAVQVHGALGLTDDTVLAYLVQARARGAHLRRAGRGAQVGGGAKRAKEVRRRGNNLRRHRDVDARDNLKDGPREVRAGEELDEEKLLAYLRAHLPEIEGPLAVEQFPAGFSNLTYLVRDGVREFVLRRPPFGSKVKTAHDMGREFLILSRLRPVYAKVPRPLLYCDDESVLGAHFYLMERVGGVILRARPPAGLELSPELMRRVSESFVENLAEIHAVDYVAAGLSELGRPEGYVARQVEGWTKRFYAARTDDVPAIEKLARWLADNTPPERGSALIHNDYKYDNVVFAPGDLARVVARCSIGRWRLSATL